MALSVGLEGVHLRVPALAAQAQLLLALHMLLLQARQGWDDIAVRLGPVYARLRVCRMGIALTLRPLARWLSEHLTSKCRGASQDRHLYGQKGFVGQCRFRWAVSLLRCTLRGR